MYRVSRVSASPLCAALVCASLGLYSSAQVSLRSVNVLGSKNNVEIEVQASRRIVPQTRILTGPDRLVIDFPNAVPTAHVRNQSVDRGEVRDVRVGLFQARPPVARVVVDLKSPRSYQIFPSTNGVIIKVMGEPAGALQLGDSASPQGATLVRANYATGAAPMQIEPSAPPLQVSYSDGLLGIHANRVTLSAVLSAVQQKTGAQISMVPGADQEQVVVEYAPAPAPEVLARLLNGSRFNFMILSAPNDPGQLDRIILTNRGEGGWEPPPQNFEPPMQAEAQRPQGPTGVPPLANPDSLAFGPGPEPAPAADGQSPPVQDDPPNN
jgi:AMIN domain